MYTRISRRHVDISSVLPESKFRIHFLFIFRNINKFTCSFVLFHVFCRIVCTGKLYTEIISSDLRIYLNLVFLAGIVVPRELFRLTATFCEVGCILAWTPITESKVLNYVLIAESTVSSTGAGLAASLSFGEIGADLLGMVGDNPFHSI